MTGSSNGIGTAAVALVVAVASLASPHTPVRAAGDEAEDWPCQQALVPELSYRLLWTGPSPEPYFDDWADDTRRARVVRTVATIDTPTDQARERLAAYLSSNTPLGKREKAKVFAGIFQTLNENRKQAIAAIRRYSRGQKATLEKISKLLRELDDLMANEAENRKAIERTREQLGMTRQVFQERREAIRAICEQPTLMKQRLGDLLRVIRSTG